MHRAVTVSALGCAVLVALAASPALAEGPPPSTVPMESPAAPVVRHLESVELGSESATVTLDFEGTDQSVSVDYSDAVSEAEERLGG